MDNFYKYLSELPSARIVKFKQTDRLRQEVNAANIRKVRGVYVVLDSEIKNVLYIGTSGQYNNKNGFGDQTIPKRLINKQNKQQTREQYFIAKMGNTIKEITINCYETINVLPSKAEADLFQLYFDVQKKLPSWNNAF